MMLTSWWQEKELLSLLYLNNTKKSKKEYSVCDCLKRKEPRMANAVDTSSAWNKCPVYFCLIKVFEVWQSSLHCPQVQNVLQSVLDVKTVWFALFPVSVLFVCLVLTDLFSIDIQGNMITHCAVLQRIVSIFEPSKQTLGHGLMCISPMKFFWIHQLKISLPIGQCHNWCISVPSTS